MAIVTPTDRPKSVRNRCVIEVFGGVCVFTLLFGFFCRCRGFCHRTKSDLFPFHLRTLHLHDSRRDGVEVAGLRSGSRDPGSIPKK